MSDTFEKLKAQKDMILARQAETQQDIICIGMDAFRCCVGLEPRQFTRDEIIRWIRISSPESRGDNETER